MATIYFVRHGESEANLLREFSNTGIKHPLTERGRKQAQTLAEHLIDHDISRIISTPILRAQETAEILASVLNLSFETSEAHTEYDVGRFEGRRDDEAWAEYFEVLDAWLLRSEYDVRVAGGESFNEMKARFIPFVETLRNEPGNIAMVGHNGTYRCMLPCILENVDHAFTRHNELDNTAYVVASPTENGWTCVEWCGTTL